LSSPRSPRNVASRFWKWLVDQQIGDSLFVYAQLRVQFAMFAVFGLPGALIGVLVAVAAHKSIGASIGFGFFSGMGIGIVIGYAALLVGRRR